MSDADYYYKQSTEDMLNGDWDAYVWNFMLGTISANMASEFGLTTKRDRRANHNVMLPFNFNPLSIVQDHFALHTPSVWNRVKGECGLK